MDINRAINGDVMLQALDWENKNFYLQEKREQENENATQKGSQIDLKEEQGMISILTKMGVIPSITILTKMVVIPYCYHILFL